jgi:hypothetical protein
MMASKMLHQFDDICQFENRLRLGGHAEVQAFVGREPETPSPEIAPHSVSEARRLKVPILIGESQNLCSRRYEVEAEHGASYWSVPKSGRG